MSQAPRARVARRPVHGVLLLDKPLNCSSNDALQKARRLLSAEKAGHTGTLDPLATGVLPLCFGAATKFSQIHLDADKRYEAVLHLGIETSTADAEGSIVSTREVGVTSEALQDVCRQFTGPISQLPPMHSALKKDGKALYDYARAGIEVERTAREVVIRQLELHWLDDDPDGVFVLAKVHCSKGTYIRTLGQDIGRALGCGAHLASLRRVQTGNFDLSRCVGLDQLESMSEAQRLDALLPVDSLLAGWPCVELDTDEAARFLSGLRRRGPWSDARQVAVFGPQRELLGSARVQGGELIAQRLLNPDEIKQIAQARAPCQSMP